MAHPNEQPNNLKAGEFYGSVSAKRSISSSVISEVVHTDGKKLPSHSHELAFFSLLVDGAYSESFGRKSHTYGPMTVWWHPADIFHRDEIGDNGGRFLNIEIRKESVELLRSYAAVPEDFFEMNTALVWLACRLYSEFRNWDIGSELIAEGLTLEMLAHSARSEVEKEKRPTAWLRQVIERLNDDYLDTPSTESLARDAGVHPVHLAAVFRKYKKQTINEYVQQLRVGHASKLLSDKEKTLADIALTCGFSDQSHFTRMFKRVTGMTPGAFRKSLA